MQGRRSQQPALIHTDGRDWQLVFHRRHLKRVKAEKSRKAAAKIVTPARALPRAAAPAFDFRQLGFRPLGNDFTAAQIDCAGFAVDREPVALFDRGAGELRPTTSNINRQSTTADDARLPHLPRNQRRMSGSAANGGDDAVGNGKPADVSRRGVRANEDDRFATGSLAGPRSANRKQRVQRQCRMRRKFHVERALQSKPAAY